MRYRLALDLGSSSIGWALLRLNSDNEPMAIIRAGVRIFSDGRVAKSGESLAVTRRDARAMRRRRDRLLKRKHRLFAALCKLGFFPAERDEQQALLQLDPYQLRAEGLQRALSGAEFARALFHINQRRGFQSNRKADTKDNESGALKQAIAKLQAELQSSTCQTLGQWLYQRHQQGLSVRARLRGKTQKDKAYDFYASRAMVLDEFDQLWRVQNQFQPDLFHAAAGAELRDILERQRNLKPVKPGRCTLLPDEYRAALALPSTQRFRIYQELNNLRILHADLQEQSLSLAQRDILADLLESEGQLSFSKMVKALKLPGASKFNLEDIKRSHLRGNATSVALAKASLFGSAWASFSHAKQDEIVCQILQEESEQKLVTWLQENTGIDEACAERIANAGLPQGFGSLSLAALQRILPELQQAVISFDKAVEQAGLGSHSQLSHFAQTGEIMAELPYYGIPLRRHVAFPKDKPRNDEERYGKIANPTVHIGLNQLRGVVNALIKEYGAPSQIIVELARELKLSRARQLEIKNEQAANQTRNDKLVEEACKVLGLQPLLLDRSKRRQLSQKMQLWCELNPKDALQRFCPYSGEPISINRLLSAEVEIEHILPFSQTLDDSMANKTVALSRANRIKGNHSPYQAFGEYPQEGFDYAAILQRAASMPAAKRARFAADGLQRWLNNNDDFAARALTDTAYLSRIAREYLSCICPEQNVYVIPGRMTAMLRGKFGLNELLSGNHEKNREDHRHHALDAMVIGITDRGMLQKFARASKEARELGLSRLLGEIDAPWDNYREHVARALAAIWVSYRPDHAYQGAMHEDTAWGPLANGQAQRRVRPEGGGARERKIENKSLVTITAPDQEERHGLGPDGQPKAYKGYIGGSNYCIEIWRDEKGNWQGEVISTFAAYQIVRKLGETAGWQRLRHPTLSQSGKPLVMRVMNRDYLRLELDGKLHTMVVATIKANGQMIMYPQHEANVDARNRDKNNPFAYTSKTPGTLQKVQGRRCTVSPTGRLRDPGFQG